MEKKWFRIDEYTVLHRPTNTVYKAELYMTTKLMIKNYRVDPIFASNMTVKKDNIENFDLKAKQGGLLYGTESKDNWYYLCN